MDFIRHTTLSTYQLGLLLLLNTTGFFIIRIHDMSKCKYG